MRRSSTVLFLALLLALSVACTNKKSVNPLANVGSKQPDKVLFDRAMDAMKHNRFDVSRMTLQTLINTYPDSEFIARAKLAVADCTQRSFFAWASMEGVILPKKASASGIAATAVASSKALTTAIGAAASMICHSRSSSTGG